MSTITIPQELLKEKRLVAIPHKTYEDFLDWQKMIKSQRTFNPTSAEKKSLLRARKNIVKGNYLTLAELRDALGIEN
ncbi:hypothetical protein HY732_01045 [Candidatus Uhrbacteria bacterium]|nr:hypothetical protein [Candidatus Uhrbacteria bacterium]